MYFKWDPEKKEYVADSSTYDGDPFPYRVMGFLPAEEFQKEYAQQLDELRTHGTAGQRRWAQWFDTRMEKAKKPSDQKAEQRETESPR